MKYVIAQWTYYDDLLECPDEIADNIVKYQQEFDIWINSLEDKEWLEDYTLGDYLPLTIELFIKWINHTNKNKENVRLVNSTYDRIKEDYIKIWW